MAVFGLVSVCDLFVCYWTLLFVCTNNMLQPPLPASYNHMTHHQSLIPILCHQCVVSPLFFLLRFYFLFLWCACDPAYTPWCDLGGTWCVLPQSVLFVTTNPCHCHAHCLYPTPLLSLLMCFCCLHSMYNIHPPSLVGIVVFPLTSKIYFILFCSVLKLPLVWVSLSKKFFFLLSF